MTTHWVSTVVAIATFAVTNPVAAAHPLTITFAGNGTGSIGSSGFTNASFTIIFTSDTSRLTIPSCCVNDLTTPGGTPATISVNGVNADFSEDQAVFVNPNELDVGIWHLGGPDFLTIGNKQFATYNLATNIGPIDGTTSILSDTFSTSEGILAMSSVSNVTVTVVVSGPNPWRIVGAADFNRDGMRDTVWQDPEAGAAQVFFMNGADITGFAGITGRNAWRIVGVGDFDQDGTPDLVWQDSSSGAAQIWLMGGADGTTRSSAKTVSNGNSWRIVAVADFNRDGVPDLVWQDPSSGMRQVWFMGGAEGTTFTESSQVSRGNAWRIVAAADFNQDGVPDLVWQDPSTGSSQVWFMGGAQGTTLTGTAKISGSNSWRIVAAGDFNGDGIPDLIWQDPSTTNAQVWHMGGAQGATRISVAAVSGATP